MLDWIRNFLSQRGIEKPDKRPLFQYRVSEEEYNQLIDLLKIQNPAVRHNLFTDRLFVLYASEWWRRNYSGGAWAWRSIIDPLGWTNLSHAKLAEMVRAGLKYWGRPLLTYQDANTAFLLSIVIEGGFPVNILETSGNKLTRYLKALLNDFASFRGSGISTQKLAEDLANYLPKGFRRPGVYQLAANLVTRIDELADSLDLKKDPFKQLEEQKPGWQDSLPFVLESDNAKHMINGLLQQAKRSRSGDRGQLRLRRNLTKQEGQWIFNATLILPGTIAGSVLAKSLDIAESQLPSRAELTLEGAGQLRKVAQLVKVNDDYNVYAYDKNRLEVNVLPSDSITCSLTSYSNYVGQLNIDGGESINPELPILLASSEGNENELEVIGQGGLSTRRPSVVTLIPDSSEIVSVDGVSEGVEGKITDAALIKLQGSMRVMLSDGLFCLIKTAQDKDSSNSCRITGKRQYPLETSSTRVFSGIPQFSVLTQSGLHKSVALDEVKWRSTRAGQNWYSLKEEMPLGEVDVRVLQDGSCILFEKVIILPESFHYHLLGGDNPTTGTIQLSGLNDVIVGSPDDRAKIENIVDAKSIEILCESAELDRKRIPLVFRWESNLECQLQFPFPSTGAIFTKSDNLSVIEGDIPIGNLIHITATGISHSPGTRYHLMGSLFADDITPAVSRNLAFNLLLDTQGDGFHELPLLRLFNQVSELFSFSADLDARVVLEIVSEGERCAKLDVVQFEGELKYHPEAGCISYVSNLESEESLLQKITQHVSLFPFCENPDDIIVTRNESNDQVCQWGVQRPNAHFLPVMATLSENVRSVRPCLVFDPLNDLSKIEQTSNFKTAWLEPSLENRLALLDQAMEDLLEDDTEWPVLEAHIKFVQDAHPDCLDTCNVIIENPVVLAGAFLRLGSDYIGMFEDWQDYLPFKWWQLPVSAWKLALKSYQSSLEKYDIDADMQDTVLQQKWADLVVLRNRIPQLKGMIDMLGFELFNQKKPQLTALIEKNLHAVFAHLNTQLPQELMRSKADAQWPNGPGREWWLAKIQAVGYDGQVFWLDDHGSGFRRPFLDAVIGASTVVAFDGYLDREARVIASAARTFAPENFDQMFQAAFSIFYSQLHQ